MTHQAIVFGLSERETGCLLGQAVVCAAARYASIMLIGAHRLSRCHAPAQTWKSVEAELALGLSARPLEKSSALVELLAAECRTSARLQYVAVIPVGRVGQADRVDYTHGLLNISTDDNNPEDFIYNRVFSVTFGFRLR